IVVIILTLIVAFFGILNKKRKKEVKSGQPVPSAGGSQDFWEMLLDNEHDVPQDVQQPVHEEEVLEEAVPEPKPAYEFKADREAAHSIKEPMEKSTNSKKRRLARGDGFSLKKAVIYSEIINRKYM
ncbi:MAG TPA: hypothetical protein VEP89_16385, partial [Draconibacterium sp.]|nr:hypothetical protein [Draconibacterium sp.]